MRTLALLSTLLLATAACDSPRASRELPAARGSSPIVGGTLDNGHEALGYTSGKMKRFRIKIFPGDRIKLELSPYDLTRGRIVYRYR